MNEFEHERLDVYQAAIQFLVLADGIAGKLPRGLAGADKARFYRMARRSATESAAILDACRALSLTTDDGPQPGRVVLLRIVAMLTAMVVKRSGSGSGSGSGDPESVKTSVERN